MAIGFALVYRVMRDAPPPAIVEAVTLPAGATVLAAAVHAGTVNVTYRLDGQTLLALFDQESGELTGTIAIR